METKRHDCDMNSPYEGSYGPAIDYCFEQDNGKYYAGNGEYSSQVNYCPKCGTKAPTSYIPTHEEK